MEELRNDGYVEVVGVSDERNIAGTFTKCLRSTVFKWRVEQIREYVQGYYPNKFVNEPNASHTFLTFTHRKC